jgi:hypothetical protein
MNPLQIEVCALRAKNYKLKEALAGVMFAIEKLPWKENTLKYDDELGENRYETEEDRDKAMAGIANARNVLAEYSIKNKK